MFVWHGNEYFFASKDCEIFSVLLSMCKVPTCESSFKMSRDLKKERLITPCNDVKFKINVLLSFIWLVLLALQYQDSRHNFLSSLLETDNTLDLIRHDHHRSRRNLGGVLTNDSKDCEQPEKNLNCSEVEVSVVSRSYLFFILLFLSACYIVFAEGSQISSWSNIKYCNLSLLSAKCFGNFWHKSWQSLTLWLPEKINM